MGGMYYANHSRAAEPKELVPDPRIEKFAWDGKFHSNAAILFFENGTAYAVAEL